MRNVENWGKWPDDAFFIAFLKMHQKSGGESCSYGTLCIMKSNAQNAQFFFWNVFLRVCIFLILRTK